MHKSINEHVKNNNNNKMVKTRASQRGNGTNSFKAQSLQRGYGISVYRGRSMQRGHGLGGLFKGIFRVAVPILRRTVLKAGKKAIKTLGKRALKAGYGAIKDVAHDRENLRDALQKRALEIVNPPQQKTINRAPKRKRPIKRKKPLQGKAKSTKINAPFL